MMKKLIFKFAISLFLIITPCYANTYVSTAPVLTEIIYALEAQNNLLGVSSVCNYPKEVKNKLIIGNTYYVNTEKLIQIKPNYIFSLTSSKPLLSELFHTDIKPIYFNFYNIEDIYSGINKIAKISNKEKNAKKLITNIKAEILKNKATVSKKILYVIEINPFITIGNKSFINDVIEKSGHKSVTSNIDFQYPIVTMEYVMKTKPDIIVMWDNNNEKELKKIFPSTKIIKLSPKERDIINRPGPRVAEAVKLFANIK